MLLLHNFWLRLSSLFNPKKQLGRFLGLVFGVIFSVLYGLLFGYLFSSDEWEEVDLSSKENFLIGFAGFLFFTTILKGFYPSYQQLGTWVRPFFPLSKIQRYNLKLSADFASVFFIPTITFILSFCFMANDALGWPYILKFIIILIIANIIRRMIQALIEFRMNRNGMFWAGLISAITGMISLQVFHPIYGPSPVWSDIITMLLIYGCGIIMEEFLPFERKQAVQPQKKNSGIITSLLFQNKKIRSSLIVGAMFKMGILGVDTYLFNKSGDHLFNSDFLLWLFASPVLIFNYVFNNTWGYNRALWLTLDKSPEPGRELQFFYLRLIGLPLFLDFVLSAVYFAFRSEWVVIGLVSWVTLAIICLVFGFYWSMVKPKLILKTISTKGNTYIWSNLLSMLFVMLLYGMLFTKWLYWLVPVYLVVSGLVFYYAKKEYPELRKEIFQELFKE